MKINTVKQECADGDKATIKGTVKWVGKVEPHDGKDGTTFRTQDLLIADGEKTDDNRNSMFCGFYADKSCWDYLKDSEVTVQGTVNVWKTKMSLKGCKIKDDVPQSAPQQGQQAPSQARQSPNVAKSAPQADMTKSALVIDIRCRLVCAIIQSDREPDLKSVADLAKFILDGRVDATEPQSQPSDPPRNVVDEVRNREVPPDDNIPWEQS